MQAEQSVAQQHGESTIAAATPGGATTRAPGSFSKPRAAFFNLVSLGAALFLWQMLAASAKSPYFPAPADILTAFLDLLRNGDILGNSLWVHTGASIYRLLVGFGLGVALGVPLGLLMGLYKNIYVSTRVVIEPFRFIPPIAWIPLAIIFFSGIARYAFLIFLGAFFPVFTATLVGVGRVEPIHRKVFQVHGASKLYILRHVVIPTVLPDILGGMRVGLGTAWMTIVAAELTGGEPIGLGRMMVNYSELLRIPEVMVAMILIGVIGFLCNEVLLLAEKYLFRWRWQVSL